MAKTKELWFTGFKRHSGFDKTKSVVQNLKIMYKNTHLKNPANAWRRVGRQAQVLANLSQDRVTYTKAQEVARIAFKKLAKIQE
jgi:hypothetical protein